MVTQSSKCNRLGFELVCPIFSLVTFRFLSIIYLVTLTHTLKIIHLKDLLPVGHNVQVEYRCNAPKHYDEEDMLVGFAIWNGETLESGDGDNYYLNDIIERYQCDGKHLTVWIEVKWSGEND